MDSKKILFECIKLELSNSSLDIDLSKMTKEQLGEVIQLAKKHDLMHFIAKALMNLSVHTQCEKVFNESIYMAVYRYEQKKYVREQMASVFERSNIAHIFLKGSVLCNYYPEPWTRTSCDIDVLVKEVDLNRAIDSLIQELNFTCGKQDSHDISLYSEEGVHIELHYDLIESLDCVIGVLSRVWQTKVQGEKSSSQYTMTDEMFYFYHIAHMAKHFLHGGCGIRSVLDVWILNNRISYDKRKRNQLLEEGELSSFAREVEYLSEVWFGNAEYNHTSEMLEEYILSGGVYGNVENKVTVQRSKGQNKLEFIIKRIFMPYKEMALEYPTLKHTPVLLPIFWVYRWFRCMNKRRIYRAMEEFKMNSSVIQENQLKTKELIEILKLDILNG